MKRKQFAFIILIFSLLVLFSTTSCEKSCSGMGTLKLTNKSLNTVQKIMIDGVNHGTIDPGEEKEISLAAGEHDFQQVGISGGTGCSAASVIIIECETTGFSCSN
ncbi:MAG: hypothetical protein H8E34_00645 [Bacteroidetes bacterium]|nr:hypothetical protein [Bacteroidota bacterium]MBL6944115.1 hypothetical protein [Bacteroidales bacterium]